MPGWAVHLVLVPIVGVMLWPALIRYRHSWDVTPSSSSLDKEESGVAQIVTPQDTLPN